MNGSLDLLSLPHIRSYRSVFASGWVSGSSPVRAGWWAGPHRVSARRKGLWAEDAAQISGLSVTTWCWQLEPPRGPDTPFCLVAFSQHGLALMWGLEHSATEHTNIQQTDGS